MKFLFCVKLGYHIKNTCALYEIVWNTLNTCAFCVKLMRTKVNGNYVIGSENWTVIIQTINTICALKRKTICYKRHIYI